MMPSAFTLCIIVLVGLATLGLPIGLSMIGASVFYLLVAVVYWCYGTQLSVFASASADLYGTRNLGLNYGLLFTAWGVAGILGPLIAAGVYDASGAYRYAFYAASALAVIAWCALTIANATALSPDRVATLRQSPAVGRQ